MNPNDLITKLTQTSNPKDKVLELESGSAVLPYEHCTYSIVVNRLPLHQFTNPLALLHEMTRVAKWEGRVIVVDDLANLTQLEAMLKQADLTLFEQHKLESLVVMVAVKQVPENYALGCCG